MMSHTNLFGDWRQLTQMLLLDNPSNGTILLFHRTKHGALLSAFFYSKMSHNFWKTSFIKETFTSTSTMVINSQNIYCPLSFYAAFTCLAFSLAVAFSYLLYS